MLSQHFYCMLLIMKSLSISWQVQCPFLNYLLEPRFWCWWLSYWFVRTVDRSQWPSVVCMVFPSFFFFSWNFSGASSPLGECPWVWDCSFFSSDLHRCMVGNHHGPRADGSLWASLLGPLCFVPWEILIFSGIHLVLGDYSELTFLVFILARRKW